MYIDEEIHPKVANLMRIEGSHTSNHILLKISEMHSESV